MPLKFSKSKIDINTFQRKGGRVRPANQIKREVVPEELRFLYRKAKQKIIETPIVVDTLRPLGQVVGFGLAVLVILILLQGLSFVSSAVKTKSKVLGAATSVYDDLHSASQNLTSQNFEEAQSLFGEAQTNISLAQNELSALGPLNWLSPQASSANHLLAGASFLAQAGSKLSANFSQLSSLKVNGTDAATTDIISAIAANKQGFQDTLTLVKQAADEFDAIGSLPADYSQTLSSAKSQVTELGTILDKLITLEDLYLSLFQGQKTYMLIFQNADEERATGGFIGTYGVADTSNGKIDHMKIESIYQLDGQIFNQIAAPGPFQPAIARWGIRDANWFIDFPTSAQKLLSFFESGSQTADGLISATPQFFEDLLRLTGPIQMDQYSETLTADNFQQIVQFETSVNYDKTLNQPKKFLADFAPIFLDKLSHLPNEQMLAALQILQNNLNNRSLLLYSKDQDTEAKIKNLGYSGEVLATDSDYLSINNSNLGGTKTDLSMNQSVILQSKILPDASVVNVLTIDRKNQASTTNKDYLRVLVPLNSQFVSASGFDQYDYHNSTAPGLDPDPDLTAWDKGSLDSNVYTRTEAQKTEFAGWVNTDPGQDKVLTLTYVLPFKAESSYSLLLQKQAGAKPFSFSASLDLGNLKTVWLGDGVTNSGQTASFASNSNTDDFWPLVLSK